MAQQYIAAGDTATVLLKSDSYIRSTYAGDVLTVVFTASPSAQGAGSTTTTMQVAQPVQPPTPTGPTVPTGLHQVGSTTSSVTIGWNQVSGASAIQIGHVLNGQVTIVKNLAGTATQATIPGLNPGYPETLEVRAVANGQYSAWTSPIIVYTQSTTAPTPTPTPTPVPTPTPIPTPTPTPTPSACSGLQAQLSQLEQQQAAIKAAHPNCFEGGNAPGSYCAGIVNEYEQVGAQGIVIVKQMQTMGCFG